MTKRKVKMRKNDETQLKLTDTMKTKMAINLCLSDAALVNTVMRIRSMSINRWLRAWHWALTSPQPIRLLKDPPYMILFESSDDVVTCFSSSLADVLFNLHYECQVSLFSAIPIFFPPKVFTYHQKIMLLSKSSKKGARIASKCIVINSVSLSPSSMAWRGSFSTLSMVWVFICKAFASQKVYMFQMTIGVVLVELRSSSYIRAEIWRDAAKRVHVLFRSPS